MSKINDIIQSHQSAVAALKSDKKLLSDLELAADYIIKSIKKGGSLYLCGNGGSAADAQHIACELSGRFLRERRPLPAEALHTNSSFMTSVANDYSFEEVYSRAIEAYGKPGDVLIGLSTSGNSINVVNALKKARSLSMSTIGFTGQHKGDMVQCCDIILHCPSSETPRIQEMHILIGHILCELVELAFVD